MSATQRATRQKNFRATNKDDDGARPAKRAKFDLSSDMAQRQTNGRKPTTRAQKAQAAYEEEANGFQFSRKRTRKTPANDIVPEAVTHPGEQITDSSRRKHKSSVDGRAASESGKGQRKSARLSGEDVQQQTIDPPLRKPKKVAKEPESMANGRGEDNPVTSRVPTNKPLDNPSHTERHRNLGKIPLPLADTPVITRNKEMRKTSAQVHRRSSSGMRGNRASSLIDSGTSNALPHDEVETSDFYKHISQDLPEPRRMRQLLTWCATRAFCKNQTSDVEPASGTMAARAIEEELLKDFSCESKMSDWFDRDDSTSIALVKKPNPRNQQNAAKLLELEQEVKRLRDEKSTWDMLLKSLASSVDFHSSDPEVNKHIDSSLLADAEQVMLLQGLQSQADPIIGMRLKLEALTKSLEFNVDCFADGVHRLESFAGVLQGVVTSVQKEGQQVLSRRHAKVLEDTGMAGAGTRNVLKALSRAKI